MAGTGTKLWATGDTVTAWGGIAVPSLPVAPVAAAEATVVGGDVVAHSRVYFPNVQCHRREFGASQARRYGSPTPGPRARHTQH